MIIVLVLTCAFFAAMLYEICVIERNKVEILTLYSYLHFQEIKDVYSACDQYMTNLNRGSLLQDLQLDQTHLDEENQQEFKGTATPTASQLITSKPGLAP
jgi:galactose-1-phosphate uridylyltransferase